MGHFIDEIKRTHSCGALRSADIGKEVVLFGWVDTHRDFGKFALTVLRDREGVTQLIFDPERSAAAHTASQHFKNEYVIGIRGNVRSRGMQFSKKENKMVSAANPNLATGEIEVEVLEAVVFNKAEPLPFSITDDVKANEDTRLEHRYLDLRRGPLQKALMMRSTLNAVTRAYFVENKFLELETPFMGRYTPGGARNFLVPSRLNSGKFYALAESPQLYKQLFMVAGFDRYFQIVKCFRDEDLRIDRQPEFTQIDVEMSFVSQDDIFQMIEGLLARLWKAVHNIDLPLPFRRMNFDEAMARYGNDKPDLRFDLPHVVLNDIVKQHGAAAGVSLLSDAVSNKGLVKAMVVPAAHQLGRADLDRLEALVKGMGAGGLARAKLADNGEWTQASLFKNASSEFKADIVKVTEAKPGDLILFQFGKTSQVHTVMANLRVAVAKKLKLIPESGSGGHWNFLWVVNPPLFEFDDETNTWAAAHHAFTRPHDECLPHLKPEQFAPEKVYCYRYDVVLNGFEIGGGSIRLHDPEVQAQVFRALGIADEDARAKFGFLLDALKFGAPPHGGIALGMDRLAFLIAEAESLRDVIPFPKTQRGTDLMTGAPGDVDGRQLKELHVQSVAVPKQTP
jgi:aspartyl-tRNA synthetase